MADKNRGEISGFVFSVFGPKGLHMKAQGEALGIEKLTFFKALKERNKRRKPCPNP